MSNTFPESIFVQKFRANTFTSRLPAAGGNNYGEQQGNRYVGLGRRRLVAVDAGGGGG